MTLHQKEAIEDALEKFGVVSTAYLQRKLQISYNKAIYLINEFNKLELNKSVLD